MKTKKITKIVSILFMIVMILGAVNTVLGAGTGVGTVPSIPKGVSPAGASDVTKISGMVIYVIQIIAFTAGVIMLVFLGIKFITASPEGKAEIKKSAVIYVVGAILLFAATGILSIVQALASNVTSGSAQPTSGTL